MRARVLAIIAAVVLVAGAVLIRSAITDDGDDQSCAAGSAKDCGDGGGGSGRPRVACTPDLDAVCDALAAEEAIEKVAPVDLNDAVARAEGLDGWLTYGAAPTMVGYDVSNDPRQGPYDLAPAPIASARLTAVVPPGSDDGVGDDCLQAPTWACLDAAIRAGKVPLAVGDSEPMSASAITALGPLADAGSNGDPDAFLRAAAPAYGEALVDGDSIADQLGRLVTAPGLTYVAVAPDAKARETVRQAERRGSEVALRALAARPVASSVVVLARTRTGDLGNDVEEALLVDGASADALAALGYRTDPDAVIPTRDEAGFLWQVREALDR